MPTPRAHGGAGLAHIPLNLPGFKGLNLQTRGALLGPEWATRLENTVLDKINRVAARKGYNETTVTGWSTENATQIAEYRTHSGTRHIIAVTDGDTLYASTDAGVTYSDVTNTATVTDTNMQFVNFNDSLYGIQDGGTVVVYAGTNFVDHAPAGITDGSAGLSAFGRLWISDSNGHDIAYSALLDATDFNGSDAGVISLENVWDGTDVVVAMAEHNGALVVFGRRNIVVYTDGQGSALGIDPLQMYVADTISGIGCLARDTVQAVDGDLWFLSETGLVSLQRLITQKSNPLSNLSSNIQDALLDDTLSTTATTIRSVYSPVDNLYLLSIPDGSGTTEIGKAYAFDTRGKLEDGSARCTGIWFNLVPMGLLRDENNEMVLSIRSAPGGTGKYDGFLDDTTEYVMDWESAWTDLGDPNLKILKRITGIFIVEQDTDVLFKCAFDFQTGRGSTAAKNLGGGGLLSEYNIAEFGIGEYGGGIALREKSVACSGTGEHIKIGLTSQVKGELAIQQTAIYAKIGRLK